MVQPTLDLITNLLEGTVVFKPGETQKEIRVGIIDDGFLRRMRISLCISATSVSLEASEDGILEASHVSTLACLGLPLHCHRDYF